MALRNVYVSTGDIDNPVIERAIEFNWFPGFSIQQKQKSIDSLHKEFFDIYKITPLEISSKSKDKLGVNASAFNLEIFLREFDLTTTVECAFQGAKVFEKGGPYVDLLSKTSREAKKDNRLKESGSLLEFRLAENSWPIMPKTAYYCWLYVLGVSQSQELSQGLISYSAFTDIEFNNKKSLNCQAYAAALYVTLIKTGRFFDILESKEKFLKYAAKSIA